MDTLETLYQKLAAANLAWLNNTTAIGWLLEAGHKENSFMIRILKHFARSAKFWAEKYAAKIKAFEAEAEGT